VGYLFVGVIVVGYPNAQPASSSERALMKQEVIDLYAGKSWHWSDGVGYFAPKGQFSAFAGSGRDRTTVKGDWEVLDGGRLCFAGVWTGRSGRSFAKICFLHKIRDGLIYQRRMPKGEWYVFKHDPEEEGDQKLVPGDQTAR
jgi:hypothetical protein